MPGKMNYILALFASILLFSNCSKNTQSPAPTPPSPVIPPVVTGTNDMDFWLTKGDQTVLLQKQNVILTLGKVANNNAFIDVDSTQIFQTVDGFGFSLTGGSAYVINSMSATDRNNLIKELFGIDANGIGISYLRVSIGASDMDAAPFTYDDLLSGETDISLDKFSLAKDQNDVIPVLKEILAVNPTIKIMGSPWSPPVWMKDNKNFIGGSLLPEYYKVYAQYFVKYIQQMKAEGITIDAITTQNEPLYGGNNPSMLMNANQQADFIKNNLGPAFNAAGIQTKIVAYDHNCDRPDFPISVLSDAGARPFVNGSAFHLYGGNITALTTVHNAFPDKQVYFTEQYTASTAEFGGDLKWHVKNVLIGSMRNWSLNTLLWNLATDASYGPHTAGGCSTCKGAVTIATGVTRNVGYYIIGHASKFVPPGSVRIGSNNAGDLQSVAFVTPAGKKVLIVENDGTSTSFNIRYKGKWVTTSLTGGSVGTFIW
ncbi:MAG: glycoside hydrolase family 30 beta sandwich domain-containing protein [Ginsengibacter sp.]